MTPREAEQLLGGYATGTLSEAERQALFSAALEDQALFDALADEEALRELLADSGTRARLLTLLAEPARRPAIPLWRRPAVMGLAASILAAVGVGLALRHGPAPEAARNQAPALSEEQLKTAAPSKDAPQTPQSSGVEKKRSRALPLPKPAPKLDRAPAAPPPPAPAASAAPREENLAAPAPMREKAEAKQAQDSAEAGVSLGGALYRAQGAAMVVALPPPTWTLDADPAGTFHLKVRWEPGGHLYLLRRNASGVSVLAPAATSTQDGMQESVFTGHLDAGSALDLYLLPKASPAPASLPAEGAVPGFRSRIWPVKEKAP